ncbi:MAG: hypothetical protein QXD70_01780 [Candidatus Bathyarchaeia archaeon]
MAKLMVIVEKDINGKIWNYLIPENYTTLMAGGKPRLHLTEQTESTYKENNLSINEPSIRDHVTFSVIPQKTAKLAAAKARQKNG